MRLLRAIPTTQWCLRCHRHLSSADGSRDTGAGAWAPLPIAAPRPAGETRDARLPLTVDAPGPARSRPHRHLGAAFAVRVGRGPAGSRSGAAV
ncbi:hypothetical protein [Nocardia sp. NPDC003726]